MNLGRKSSSIDDFVVMMFLIGNDFLPHNPAFENMSDTILFFLDIYIKGSYILTITDENGRHHINWDNFKLFIKDIEIKENELLSDLAKKNHLLDHPSRFIQKSIKNNTFSIDVFRTLWYNNALGSKGPKDFTDKLNKIISEYEPSEYENEINPILTNITINSISTVTSQRIELMALDYMRTMSWNYLYYREGTNAINIDWAYLYYHAPMIKDLSAVMQAVNITVNISGYEAYKGMPLFTALHQLIAVLPLKSKDLLPIELQQLFSYDSIIRDFYPDDFIIEMDGKNKNQQGNHIIPFIDRQRVIDAVGQIVFTPERAKIWMPVEDIKFIRTEEEAEKLSRELSSQQKYEKQKIYKEKSRGRGDIGRGRGDIRRDRSDIGRGRSDIGRGRGDIGRGRSDIGRDRGGISEERKIIESPQISVPDKSFINEPISTPPVHKRVPILQNVKLDLAPGITIGKGVPLAGVKPKPVLNPIDTSLIFCNINPEKELIIKAPLPINPLPITPLPITPLPINPLPINPLQSRVIQRSKPIVRHRDPEIKSIFPPKSPPKSPSKIPPKSPSKIPPKSPPQWKQMGDIM